MRADKISVILDHDLLEQARQATGIQEPAELMSAGMEALIARSNAAKRLAAMGGSDPKLKPVLRHRTG